MQQRKAYRQVPNINLIPPEYQPPVIFSRRLLLPLLLVLVIAVEAFLIQSLLQESSSIEAGTATIEERLRRIEGQLEEANARKEQAAKLAATIEALQKAHDAVAADWAGIRTKHADWPQVMSAFFQRPEGIELDRITKVGATEVDVTGSAADYVALLQYRRALQRSPAILRMISLESVRAESSVSFSLAVEVTVEGQ